MPSAEYQTGCRLEREGYLVFVNNSIFCACHLLSIKLGADLSEKGRPNSTEALTLHTHPQHSLQNSPILSTAKLTHPQHTPILSTAKFLSTQCKIHTRIIECLVNTFAPHHTTDNNNFYTCLLGHLSHAKSSNQQLTFSYLTA
jgi:hypothetical protein